MSLPLCTPEKIECVIKVKDEVKDEECLPQCSGVKITYHKEDDILKKVKSSNELQDLVLNSPITEHSNM